MFFVFGFLLVPGFVLNHNIRCFCFASCFIVVVVVVVLLLLLLFGFCCFGICFFFEVWRRNKNISQKLGNSENPKDEKHRKRRTFWQEQLAQLCSQIVFFFSLLCVFKFCMFRWKPYQISGCSPQKQKKKMTNFQSYRLVQVKVKNWSKHVARQKWTVLKLWKVCILLFFVCFSKYSSFCWENEIFKNKRNKQDKKRGPVFNFEMCQNRSKICFAGFSPIVIVFCFKAQIVCRGAKIFFDRLSGCQKGFWKNAFTALSCLPYVGERKKKRWKRGKFVFFGGWELFYWISKTLFAIGREKQRARCFCDHTNHQTLQK